MAVVAATKQNDNMWITRLTTQKHIRTKTRRPQLIISTRSPAIPYTCQNFKFRNELSRKIFM